jgi:hypothetical protein
MSGDKAHSCFRQPVVMTAARNARHQEFETFCDFVHRVTDILAFSCCSPGINSVLRELTYTRVSVSVVPSD